MNRMYLCHDHIEQIKKITNEVYPIDYGICEICGKDANWFIQWQKEFELPVERLEILND